MAPAGESSLTPAKTDKPVIVRVKRKASQSCLDAFWLEINERPLKRALLDFDKLSISESSSKVEELNSRKVLVRHVETVTTSEVTVDILQSFVSDSPDELESKGKNAETRRTFKTENKQDQLLVKARQRQEILSKNARFEQIWRSRREKKEFVHDEAVGQMCRLYDVVRVDFEEKSNDVQKVEFPELDDDSKMMAEYLPLLREVLPNAAAEVEADILDRMSRGASLDNYVYDYYAVEDDMDITEENTASPFPLVQVQDDDDYYDGPDDSEYESDDSNAENNPLNDYPNEESSDIEEVESSCADENKDTESRSSGDSLEEDESCSGRSSEVVQEGQGDWSGNPDFLYEDEIYGDDDDFDDGEIGEIGEMHADDFGDEDWR